MRYRTSYRLGPHKERKPLRRPSNGEPIHPKDKFWFGVGVAHGRLRKKPAFPLEYHPKSGSYWERYREMYMAGFEVGRKAKGDA